jgi:hypothetical protein
MRCVANSSCSAGVEVDNLWEEKLLGGSVSQEVSWKEKSFSFRWKGKQETRYPLTEPPVAQVDDGLETIDAKVVVCETQVSLLGT